jgi:hypothetical protein
MEDFAEIPTLWKYNTKKNHQGVEHETVSWIYMDLDKGQWQGFVKIINMWVP